MNLHDRLLDPSGETAPSARATATVIALAIALAVAAAGLRSYSNLPRYVAWQSLASAQVLLFWLLTLAACRTPSRRAGALAAGSLALALPTYDWMSWRLDGWDSVTLLLGSGLLFAAVYPLGWGRAGGDLPSRRLSTPQFWLLMAIAVGLLLRSLEPGWLGATADVLVLSTELLLVVVLLARRVRWLSLGIVLLAAPALASALDVDALRRGGFSGWLAAPAAAIPYGELLARACGFLVSQDALWGFRHEVAAIALTTTLVTLVLRAAGLRHLPLGGAGLNRAAEIAPAAAGPQDQPRVQGQ